MRPGEIVILVTVEVLLSLLLFASVVALLVFAIRGPIRKYKPFDMLIFEKIKPHINTATNKIMLFITFLGKHQFLIPANLLLIFYFMLAEDRTWFTIRVIAVSISSLVLMLLLKQLFQRKRPLSPLLKAAKGLSFPSGHAIMAVSFYGLLLYILFQLGLSAWIEILSSILLIALILLIGYSRIYLMVHYASDVIAGFIIGLLWLLISLSVIRGVENYIAPAKTIAVPSGPEKQFLSQLM